MTKRQPPRVHVLEGPPIPLTAGRMEIRVIGKVRTLMVDGVAVGEVSNRRYRPLPEVVKPTVLWGKKGFGVREDVQAMLAGGMA